MKLNQEANTEIKKILSDKKDWNATPNYTKFDRQAVEGRYTDIYNALRSVGNVPREELNTAYESSLGFATRMALQYQNGDDGEQFERAFVVPMRIDRSDERYASEVLPFAPLLNPEWGVDANMRQRAVVGLPPGILDTYTMPTDSERRGALVLCPVYQNMYDDYVTSGNRLIAGAQKLRLRHDVDKNIDRTMNYVQRNLGAKVVGLGAILPVLTNFGNNIRQKELVTTTGHGGTVHLISETVQSVVDSKNYPSDAGIGVIGAAGSIGYSSLDLLRDVYGHFPMNVCDKSQERLHKKIDSRSDADKIHIKDTIRDVLESSSVIVSAITEFIDIDAIDPEGKLDLKDKVIVDDSQPGCFDRDQIEARGGRLVWVVGQDNSKDQFITRDGGYTYGEHTGFVDPYNVWGCEAEAAVIASTKQYEKAIKERVSPRSANEIGRLMALQSIEPAQYQSYGSHVTL